MFWKKKNLKKKKSPTPLSSHLLSLSSFSRPKPDLALLTQELFPKVFIKFPLQALDGGGEYEFSKAPLVSPEPKSAGRPWSLCRWDCWKPSLQLYRSGAHSVGGVVPTLGAGWVWLLCGGSLSLQEGCAATRWQWYHPRGKTQATSEGLWVYTLAPGPPWWPRR